MLLLLSIIFLSFSVHHRTNAMPVFDLRCDQFTRSFAVGCTVYYLDGIEDGYRDGKVTRRETLIFQSKKLHNYEKVGIKIGE
jgi:hypothetical protein